MNDVTQTLDLSLWEGICNYAEGMLLADVRRAFEMKGHVWPYGVALGTVQNGTRLPRPQAMATGGSMLSLRDTKRTLRTLMVNSRAAGAFIVQMAKYNLKEGGEVEMAQVQLEHREFGEWVWVARVDLGETIHDLKLGPFTSATPLKEVSHLPIKPVRLIRETYMH